MKDLSNTEPRTIAEGHWLAQPKWLRTVTHFVALPIWLAWAYLIVSGEFFEHKTLVFWMFGAFVSVALLQLFFVIRAYWKMQL